MPRPVLLLVLRIEIEKRGRARQTVGEHVIPAVAVEVVDEREEVVPRVGILAAHRAFEAGELHVRAVLLRLGRARGGVKLMALGEGRPFPPVRPGDGVGLPVLVQVAEDRAFGPVVFVELLLFERVQREVSGGGGHGDNESSDEQGERLHGRWFSQATGRGSRGLAAVDASRPGCGGFLLTPISKAPRCSAGSGWPPPRGGDCCRCRGGSSRCAAGCGAA